MISRAHRFHGYNALRLVYGRGQTIRSQLLAVKYLPNPKRTSYRAAVVVSKKVHKSAVVRARIRRRLYEIIRINSGQITQPYDIVVIVFSETIATMEATKLQDMLVDQLERAGLMSHNVGDPTTGQQTDTRGIVDTKEQIS